MTARAMWKGRVAIGKRCVPVKLYSAQQDRRIHFRLLHRDDLVPVAQRMVDPVSREEVSRDETRLAASDGSGNLVVLGDDELAAIEPEPSRTIEVVATMPAGAIPGPYIVRAYYLGPDGDDAGYRALVEALAKENAAMLVRWVMRKRDYVGAITVTNGALALVTLRAADEVLEIPAIEPKAGRAPSDREVAMAHTLVEAMDGPFEPEIYSDRYREQVIELAEQKAAGKRVAPKKRKRRAAPESLEASLAASLEHMKKAG